MALATIGCASTSAGFALGEGGQFSVDGTIASIDTKPWTYDGNAVVLLDTAAHGRVSVQLPARWNLCKATQVDVGSLAVGQRVHAVGTVTADRDLVVCENAEHRLVRSD
ncbi:MAG: hypothetical protein ACOH1P_12180 [Lysobacter sp.]